MTTNIDQLAALSQPRMLRDMGQEESPSMPITWQELQPLPRLLPEAPSLRGDEIVNMLPEPLGAWVADVSDRLQVPAESIAVCGLSALSALVGRRMGIFPRRNDDWLVLSVLWAAVVARPGQKKSAIMSEALRPLEILEARAKKEFEAGRAQQKALGAVFKAKGEVIREKIKTAAKDCDEVSLKAATQELEVLEKEAEEKLTNERRFKTNDATVEKLSELLNQNPNGLLVVRDELAGWMRSFDRPGHESDREFFLEAWNGKGAFTVDRIGRGTIHVPALCLHLIGGIQPGKLESYVYDALRGGAGDDGLLQRFQLMVYPERLGPPKWVDRKPDSEARKRVEYLYEKIHELGPVETGAVPLDEGGIPGLRFDPQAQDLFDEWYQGLELRLNQEDSLTPAFESHLAKYRSLMPGLALLFHLIDWVDQRRSGLGVSVEAARRAAMWCDFLEAHARKVYSIASDSEVHAAHELAKKIREGRVKDGDSIRNIYRHHWSMLSTQAEVEAALAILEASHWAQADRIQTEGKPREVIRIHPSLLAEVRQ